MAALFWCLVFSAPFIMAQAQSSGSQCTLPRSCRDVASTGTRFRTIRMSDGMVHVCDTQTDNGGWTVFQRRFNGDVDFKRSWRAYKYGFGNYVGDFWWGLDKVHELTRKGSYELRIEFDFNRQTFHAEYGVFKIMDESDRFALLIDRFSGNAGDSLRVHNLMEFTTGDRDNDRSPNRNCAQVFEGAWWHNNCHESNLNGIYGPAADPRHGTHWRTTTTMDLGAVNIIMMMRELDV